MPHRSLAHSALVIAPSRLENKEINVLRSAVLLRVDRVSLFHHVVCSCITAWWLHVASKSKRNNNDMNMPRHMVYYFNQTETKINIYHNNNMTIVLESKHYEHFNI